MKGQKLFVRPVEAGDSAALSAFAAQNGGDPAPAAGLIGKLVGELVATLSMQFEPDAIRIIDLVVAEELRRKRVARVMLNELAILAATMKRDWLVAGIAHREFLEHVGFHEADGLM
ncbi:MAG TPA: GNAT family N-acetyltransferase, partial [Thermoanaerobaculia bacterium]|nr:GNAT family N-acetyltransferase [Thermoanaerobaculia bacterium]